MDLKRLTEAFGPSGCEGEVRALLKAEAETLWEDVRVDRAGNLVCRRPGSDPPSPACSLPRTWTRSGFIVSGHTDDGLLRFRPVGGVDPRVAVSKWVILGRERLPGVIGAMAIHLQTPADREKVLDFDQLYIDIGAADAKEAEKLCPLGTYAVFDTLYAEMGEGLVSARALDDRVGCHSLLHVMGSAYAGDLCCAFLTGEEVGLRGSRAAALAVQPDIALVLEGTAANDLGDTQPRDQVCVPGQGVAVSFMDLASIADRGLFRQMLAAARAAGIPHQVKRAVTGGNDAGSFQRVGRGARTIVLSVPCRYIHSGVSIASLGDIQAQADLARAFLDSL